MNWYSCSNVKPQNGELLMLWYDEVNSDLFPEVNEAAVNYRLGMYLAGNGVEFWKTLRNPEPKSKPLYWTRFKRISGRRDD